ncbi:ATP-binding protein [Chryseobacterium sp. RRHN12]|uniref:ATP-binding protein n=1 Tax=Chryseobacterium sp. RRHN12 TaxID=3437884 RepID=UPI003D9BF090
MRTVDKIKQLASVDPLKVGKQTELFVGHPFLLDYNKANILVCDADKERVKGIAQGTFLLAFYDNEETVEEAILLRALAPAKLPTDSAMISSMIEYYKDNLPTSGKSSKLDDFTRYEFSFSGLECRVLGTFYRNGTNVEFGADLENFYSAHHYSVYKVNKDVLGYIVNQRDSPDIIPGNDNEFSIGHVQYSSSLRFQSKNEEDKAEVYINPTDLLGKRTALFGMTRTGKSNTVKKIIEATSQISSKATAILPSKSPDTIEENLKSFDTNGTPKYPVGQLIFDVNGEYANKNLQDEGTAIFEKYKQNTIRYSILEKSDSDFKIMKVNFYKDIVTGFNYICSSLEDEKGDYITSLKVLDFTPPPLDKEHFDEWTRYNKNKAIYFCCLNKAGFKPSTNFKVKFKADASIKKIVSEKYKELDIEKGIPLDEAENWFLCAWENTNDKVFTDYKRKNGKDWFSDEMKSLMVFLTQKKDGRSVSGFDKFKKVAKMHTNTTDNSFEVDISKHLRIGGIVIIDLSQGDPKLQEVFLERISKKIFSDSMSRFTDSIPNNFIQFYFEEAHNLFPKKDDKDLSQIYNRIAKEGAKLNLGMIYATQEVSSISSSILKNTQNWFIAHLNNEDEIRELRKYYDFDDFADALIRFSAKNDKGFVRMKTYSNPFVVPVKIDKFLV